MEQWLGMRLRRLTAAGSGRNVGVLLKQIANLYKRICNSMTCNYEAQHSYVFLSTFHRIPGIAYNLYLSTAPDTGVPAYSVDFCG